MKHFIFSAFLCFLLAPGSAQSKKDILDALRNGPSLEASESTFKYNDQTLPALEIIIHAEVNDVEKAIRKFSETSLKAPLKKDHGVFVSGPGRVETVPGDSITLAFHVDKLNNGSSLQLAMSDARGWLNPKTAPEHIIAARALLKRFAVEFYGEYYNEWIAAETKDRDKLDKEIGRLEKSISSNAGSIKSEEGKKSAAEASIRNSKNEIKDLESEIRLLEEEQKKHKAQVERIDAENEVSRKELDNAQSVVNGKISAGDTDSKDYKKAVKDLEKKKKAHESKLKEKSSIQKKADKAESEVLKAKSRLNKAESSVRDNEERVRSADNAMDKLRREISEAENDMKKKQEECNEKDGIIRDLDAQSKKLVL